MKPLYDDTSTIVKNWSVSLNPGIYIIFSPYRVLELDVVELHGTGKLKFLLDSGKSTQLSILEYLIQVVITILLPPFTVL